MPQRNGEIVRKPLRARQGVGRTLDQRLLLRFPRLAGATARVIAKLPPSSRVRQAALWRTSRLALEAFNRRDAEAVVITCHRDFEYRPGHAWVEAGLTEPSYRGLDSYRRYLANVDEVWGGENYLTPTELIDLGDRLLILASGSMRAQGSGVRLTEAFALVATLKDGRVTHLQEYYDHAEALASVGLE